MNRILCILFLLPLFVHGQKEEKIRYFTDSYVKRSAFSLAVDGAGFYSNSSQQGLGFNPGESMQQNESASFSGTIAWSSAFHMVYSIASSLEIWGGVGYSVAGWTADNYAIRQDTGRIQTDLTFINIPFQFSFRAELSDLWDLEVMPMLQLNIIDRYDAVFEYIDGETALPTRRDIDFTASDAEIRARRLNYTIGLSLSARYKFYENWSMYLRPFFNYMLNTLLEDSDIREVMYGAGLTLGMRYQF